MSTLSIPLPDGLPIEALLDVAAIDHELLPRDFRRFVQAAWPATPEEPAEGTPYVDPTPLVWGWHMDAVCDHLQAVGDGQIRRLIINIPPGFSKSMMVNVLWPSWTWARDASKRMLFSSYSEALVLRDARKMRRLIQSGWYQARWGDDFKITRESSGQHRYETDRHGVRIATTPGGLGIGERVDVICADDPHKVAQAESDVQREAVLEWWDQEMSTRDRDPKTAVRLVIMQRLHERDLAGHLLAAGGYEHLFLPMEYDGRRCVTVLGEQERRSEPGELLHPERYGEPEVAELKKRLGASGAAGQLQQLPTPAGGRIVKRGWIRGYQRPPEVLMRPAPERGDVEVVQSWDLTFDDDEGSDNVSGLVLGRIGARVYLLDRAFGPMSEPEQLRAIRSTTSRWAWALRKLVERAANGKGVIKLLSGTIAGLVPWPPPGMVFPSKLARVKAVAPFIEAGGLFVPTDGVPTEEWPDGTPVAWAAEVIESLVSVPTGVQDDDADALTQGLSYLVPRADSAHFDEVEQEYQRRELERLQTRDQEEVFRQRIAASVERDVVAAVRAQGGQPGNGNGHAHRNPYRRGR